MSPEEKTVYEFLKLFLPEDYVSIGRKISRYSSKIETDELETDELAFDISIQGHRDNNDYCFVSGSCKTMSEAVEKVLSQFFTRFKD